MMSRMRDYNYLNVRVTAGTPEDWLSVIREGVGKRSRKLLVSQNLHSVFLARKNKELRELQSKADYVRIDGLPLIWIGRLLGAPVTRSHRAGFMDVVDSLINEASSSKWKIHFIGSHEEVGSMAVEALRSTFETVQITHSHGYFSIDDERELQEVVDNVNSLDPDIVIVGMGMPKQEQFLLRVHNRLTAPVLMTCGAALDFIAGKTPMSPRWLSALGLEWLFRLLVEPRRLWTRYLIEPIFVFPLFLKDLRKRVRSGRLQDSQS